MYPKYFGLRESSFSITPDPQYLYLSGQHREALAHLLYGVGDGGGFVLLTGEVGTGKTTVCRAFLEQLPEDVDVALVVNPAMTAAELLHAICDEFRVELPSGEPSVKSMLDHLNRYLLDAHSRGRRPVLIIDEAQNLRPKVMEQIRLLTNLETAKHKLLQIFLIGQPELRTLVASPDLRQLNQRITARFHLQPLSAKETAAYVEHRVAVAGVDRPLFTGAALRRVHRLTGGVPRLINLVCERSLLGAAVSRRLQVTPEVVRHAAREVIDRRTPGMPRHSGLFGMAAALLVALALGIVIGGSDAMTRLQASIPGELLAALGFSAPAVERAAEAQVTTGPQAGAPLFAGIDTAIGDLPGDEPEQQAPTRSAQATSEAAPVVTPPPETSPEPVSAADAEPTPVPAHAPAPAPAPDASIDPMLADAEAASPVPMPSPAEAALEPAVDPGSDQTAETAGPTAPDDESSPLAGDEGQETTEMVMRAAPADGPTGDVPEPNPEPQQVPQQVLEPESVTATVADAAPVPAEPDQGSASAPRISLARAAPRVPELDAEDLSDALVDERAVIDELLRLWQVQPAPGARFLDCAAVPAFALACERSDGRWSDLRRFDRPAALKLRLPGGEDGFAVIVGLDDEHALLARNGALSRAPIATLDERWSGDFLMLWRPPPFGGRVIGVGTSADAVAWLRERLALLPNSTLTVDPARYNRDVKDTVRRFQAEYGLSADGVAGPRTLIMLSNVLADLDVPRLTHTP